MNARIEQMVSSKCVETKQPKKKECRKQVKLDESSSYTYSKSLLKLVKFGRFHLKFINERANSEKFNLLVFLKRQFMKKTGEIQNCLDDLPGMREGCSETLADGTADDYGASSRFLQSFCFRNKSLSKEKRIFPEVNFSEEVYLVLKLYKPFIFKILTLLKKWKSNFEMMINPMNLLLSRKFKFFRFIYSKKTKRGEGRGGSRLRTEGDQDKENAGDHQNLMRSQGRRGVFHSLKTVDFETTSQSKLKASECRRRQKRRNLLYGKGESRRKARTRLKRRHDDNSKMSLFLNSSNFSNTAMSFLQKQRRTISEGPEISEIYFDGIKELLQKDLLDMNLDKKISSKPKKKTPESQIYCNTNVLNKIRMKEDNRAKLVCSEMDPGELNTFLRNSMSNSIDNHMRIGPKRKNQSNPVRNIHNNRSILLSILGNGGRKQGFGNVSFRPKGGLYQRPGYTNRNFGGKSNRMSDMATCASTGVRRGSLRVRPRNGVLSISNSSNSNQGFEKRDKKMSTFRTSGNSSFRCSLGNQAKMPYLVDNPTRFQGRPNHQTHRVNMGNLSHRKSFWMSNKKRGKRRDYSGMNTEPNRGIKNLEKLTSVEKNDEGQVENRKRPVKGDGRKRRRALVPSLRCIKDEGKGQKEGKDKIQNPQYMNVTSAWKKHFLQGPSMIRFDFGKSTREIGGSGEMAGK